MQYMINQFLDKKLFIYKNKDQKRRERLKSAL